MTTPRWFAGLLLIALVLAAPGRLVACLNDSDTAAQELVRARMAWVKRQSDAILGRFERFPAAYYERRIERERAQVEKTPTALNLYDDIAVALDRLGKDDEAIAWMALKFDAMANSKPSSEDTYRYHANLGTFYIHRWFKAGADRSKMTDVELARTHVAKAVEINPGAHFGRETVQLKAIDCILKPPAMISTGWLGAKRLPSIIGEVLTPVEANQAVEGLTGLITLGNAWESIDVFNSLVLALNQSDEGKPLASWARLRAEELARKGRTSFHPAALKGEALVGQLAQPRYDSVGLRRSYQIEKFIANDDFASWEKVTLALLNDEFPASRPVESLVGLTAFPERAVASELMMPAPFRAWSLIRTAEFLLGITFIAGSIFLILRAFRNARRNWTRDAAVGETVPMKLRPFDLS